MVGELKWDAALADKCLAEYTVTIKNVGKTSIDLGLPTLNVWLATEPAMTTIAKYLDPHALMKGTPIETAMLTNDEFASHYAPDVGDSVTSVVMVKRNPGWIMMFSLDFASATGDQHWIDYRWDNVCNQLGPQGKNSTKQ